jgi:hypothetical protein
MSPAKALTEKKRRQAPTRSCEQDKQWGPNRSSVLATLRDIGITAYKKESLKVQRRTPNIDHLYLALQGSNLLC